MVLLTESKLSQIVFNDKDKLLKLNRLTHPNVLVEVKKVIEEKRASKLYPIVLLKLL